MKYQSDLCSVPNCPPLNAIPEDREAYRFVFDPICPKSFVPQGKKRPSRVRSARNPETKCSLLGLSFFASAEQAVERYNYLKANFKNIENSIGTHLATGTLQQSFGLQTPVSDGGHFDLHESAGTNLPPHFTVVQALGDSNG